MAGSPELKRGLNQRQLMMIAIGGVIGAGLFVGSGVVIKDAGPGAFLTYLLTGVMIIMVMRMLGEMATANPSTGSFADYARKAMGGWAGFSVGWLYWYFWVIVVGFEAVAGAKVITYWLPGLPLWLLSLVLMVLMTATNLFSVKSFGEFEFWFAGIKVGAIVLFLVIGAAFALGLWPGKSADFSNLVAHGGFFPNGVGAIFSAIVVVIFSMVGAEIATIAAAESEDPERAITKATRSVILRIMVFYVGAAFLLAVIVPWDANQSGASPFVLAFGKMGIPFADHLMNAVVLTAVLSCLNSGLYTASRMLFVLAARREAPAQLMRVNNRGVPMGAILASSVVGFLCVIAAAVSPDTVFLFLLNSSGAIILFVYLMICSPRSSCAAARTPRKLRVKMWLFPVLSLLTAAAIVAVLVQMAFERGHAQPAPAEPPRVGGRDRPLPDHEVARRIGGAVGGSGADRRRQPRARAGERDPDRRRAAGGAAAHRPRAQGEVLRVRPRQPRRHRAGRAQGRRVPLAGDHRSRAAAARPRPSGRCATTAWTPTAGSATTDPCARSRSRWRSSTRTRS